MEASLPRQLCLWPTPTWWQQRACHGQATPHVRDQTRDLLRRPLLSPPRPLDVPHLVWQTFLWDKISIVTKCSGDDVMNYSDRFVSGTSQPPIWCRSQGRNLSPGVVSVPTLKLILLPALSESLRWSLRVVPLAIKPALCLQLDSLTVLWLFGSTPACHPDNPSGPQLRCPRGRPSLPGSSVAPSQHLPAPHPNNNSSDDTDLPHAGRG